MASALFASRNETPPHWGERERNVYMRKTPNNSAPIGPPTSTAPAAAASSSNPNPNNHNNSSSRHYPGPAAVPSSNRRPSPLNGAVVLGAGGGGPDLEPPEDCSSFSHKGGNGGGGGGPNHHHHHHHSRHLRGQPEPGGYLAFRVAEFSRTEIRDLRRRLASELERVREISTWIGSRDLYPGAAAARSAAGSASESYGGVGEAWEVTSSSGPRQVHPRHQQQQTSWGEHPSTAPRFDGSKDRSGGPKLDPASRLPPAEGHQPPNRKGGSSTKRPPPPAPFARDPKRPNHTAPPAAVPAAPAGSEIPTPSSELMKQCSQILTKLMKHKHGWVFNRPVDAVGMGLHDYHQIVKRPMDLGTVKSKLKKKAYSSAAEFAGDVRLTFNNALLYNPEGHDVNTMAGQMLRLFEDLYGAATEKYDKDTRRSGAAREPERARTSGGGGGGGGQVEPPVSTPMGRVASQAALPMPVAPPVKPVPTPRPHPPAAAYQPPPPPPPPQQPQAPVSSVPSRAPVPKLPKPKAKDPNKREMSYEEKQKLSAGLQSLPDEKMTQVLQIVRRRNPEPAQDGDEIELDFEALDTETLWELDRFVNNCKKALSKIRRQEAIAAAAGGAPPGVAPAAGSSQGAATSKADDSKVLDAAEQHPHQQQQRDAPAEPAPANKNRRSGGGEAGDEDVDIGEDMPSTHFPSVEIERDEEHQRDEDNSSSSSDSSSGGSSSSSSSSDSDSGSSSDSDSDADDARSPAPPGGSRPQPPPR